ncbi:dephospho-CoA kinase [Micrococcaceae bacterium Sec5.8]
MLKIGLTGGIAAGKSVAASRLRELGAVVIDADALAREVVHPGTPGLEQVVAAFSKAVLAPDGGLDRPKLGALVFGDPERLAVLNGIIHPLVRERAAALADAAPKGGIVVQDIPLLVETGQGPNFHLVVVVDAPDELRVQRMMQHRHMSAADARARMAAQASREGRLAAADVVLENSGFKEELRDAVDRLWKFRLAPFADNLARHRMAPRTDGPVLVPSNPDWPRQAHRLMARLQAAAGKEVLALDHVGSTAVPGLAAPDALDLQLGVADMAAADRIAPLLADAGFPARPGVVADTSSPTDPDPAGWQQRLHANADPGRTVNLHVLAVGSPGWGSALCFRDWLRNDAAARADYLTEQRRLARIHAAGKSTAGTAADKDAWSTGQAAERMAAWAQRTSWQPPPSTGTGPEPAPDGTAPGTAQS